MRAPHEKWLGEARLTPLVGSNFRMNEFTGAVLLAQVRKLDRVVADCRVVAGRIYEGIAGLPGVELRKRPDPRGELGSAVFLGFESKARRERFQKAMAAENVPVRPPGGSIILPVQAYIEAKRGVHPAWPTWTTGRGREIRYGAECCPRTLAILDRFAGVSIDPKFSEADTRDIVAAMRKAYQA
jgi:8-amino-3,8-dideoxy-alpha-D-manno-octulosonate transaminase